MDNTRIRNNIGEPSCPFYTDEEVDGFNSEDHPTWIGEETITEVDPTATGQRNSEDDPTRTEVIDTATGERNSEDDPTGTEEVIDIGAGGDSLVRLEVCELEVILIS